MSHREEEEEEEQKYTDGDDEDDDDAFVCTRNYTVAADGGEMAVPLSLALTHSLVGGYGRF